MADTNVDLCSRPETREELYCLIDLERAYQDAKWGQVEHTHAEWVTIAVEELGEMARCAMDDGQPGRRDPVGVAREAVQAATVLIAFLEQYIGVPSHVRIFQEHWRDQDNDPRDG